MDDFNMNNKTPLNSSDQNNDCLLYTSVLLSNLFAVSETVLLHIRFTLRRAQHTRVAQFFNALYRMAPTN